MGEDRPVRVVRAGELADGDPTPGMQRQVAFEAPGLWAGVVHTAPGATSGWHHHGAHETSLFVVRGRMRLEFGPGGGESVEAGAGGFLPLAPRTLPPRAKPSPGETSTAGDARGRAGG